MDFSLFLNLALFCLVFFVYFFFKSKTSNLKISHDEVLNQLSKDQSVMEEYYSSAMQALKDSSASEQKLIDEKNKI